MGLKVVTGSFYLDGFVGNREAEINWLDRKVYRWVELVQTLSVVAHKHPQSDYAGLQKSLQQEWTFVQRVIPDIWGTFRPVKTPLQYALLLTLFQGVGEGTTEQGVTHLPVKEAGMTLPYPINIAPDNWTDSCVIT